MDDRDFGYITKLTQKKHWDSVVCTETKRLFVCFLHSQFLLSACVCLPTRVCCRNPKVPIANYLLQSILLPADQIIMVTTNFLLLLKIIILSSFINFSSTAFGKLHSDQLIILLLRFMNLIIIRSGVAHFFSNWSYGGKTSHVIHIILMGTKTLCQNLMGCYRTPKTLWECFLENMKAMLIFTPGSDSNTTSIQICTT
jgi:hypothetical protein